MGNEQNTTLDQLDASLAELVKATGLTNTLIKGDGLSIEGGKGNNFAGQGDAGKLDDMMIGKMVKDGIITKQQAKAMRGYAEGQFGGAPDDEEEDDEDADDDAQTGKAGEGFGGGDDDDDDDGDQAPLPPAKRGGRAPLAKSHSEEFATDLGGMVDVSPFLEAMSERTGRSFDRIEKSMGKSRKSQEAVNQALAKSVIGLTQLVKSQMGVIGALGERLGYVERTPMPQRGATSARALSKSMPNEQNGGKAPQKLSKAEVASTLSYLNLEKGIKQVNGVSTSQLAILAEAGGIADPAVLAHIEGWLATHPTEAQVARSYQ